MTLRLDSADWVTRIDRGELRVSHRREDGTLLAEGFAARAGIAEYRVGGKLVRELVRADTLRRAAHGLARQVVTLDHPDPRRYPNMVTPENVGELGVGDTDGEVTIHDGGYTRVSLAVRRKDALDAIDAGTTELSAGYHARIDATPGVDPEFGPYDQTQVERVYNHLAIVDTARWGRDIALRADAGVATTVIGGLPSTSPGSVPANPRQGQTARGATVNNRFMPLLSLLGVTSRVDSDDAAIDVATSEVQRRKDAADRADAEAKAKLAAETARADSEKARADKAVADLKALKDAEQARIDAAERTELDALAAKVGIDPKAHADAMALRRAIASKHLGSEVKADASDDYVRALCDLAAKQGESRGDGREAGRQLWEAASQSTRQDGRGSQGQHHDSRPKRRPTANEAHSARLAEARKAGGAA